MSLAASYSIAAIFTAKDRLSPAISKIEKRYGSFAGNVGRTLGRLDKRMNKVLKVGATAALAGIVAGTVAATREFIALDDAVTQAGAKFSDLDTRSSTYAQSLKEIQKKSREVASVTEFMATDAAGALDKMAMAGLSSKVSMGLLMGTTNLATAAGTDLTTAVDIATDSLGAFGLATDSVADAQKNLNRISDVFAKTTTTANTDLNMLFESVTAGAASFTAAGQKMETFAAFTGIMANAGIKGGQAGTSLRNVMLRLAKPTGEAAQVLKDLGIRTQDSEGNFRDVIDILADFEKGLKGMGTAQKTAALATVFGARTVTGINILLKEGSDNLREYRGELINSAGASEQMANSMRKSLKNQLSILKSSVAELGFKFVEAFEKDGRGALENLIISVQNFDMTKIVESVKKLVGFLKSMGTFILENDGLIKGLVIGMLAFKAAVIATNIVMAIQSGLMVIAPVLKFIKVIASLAKTEGILATAQLLLNTAMSANPIGLIIIAVTALIALMTILQKKFQIFSKIGDFFKGFKNKNPEFQSEDTPEEVQNRLDQARQRLAPNAAQEGSVQARLIQGRGTITVKSEDGTPLEVDNGNMNDTGWDMHSLGRDGA